MRVPSMGLALAAALLCMMVAGAAAAPYNCNNDKGCAKCVSKTKCKTCKAGYALNPTKGFCVKCKALHCLACKYNTPGTCQRCAQGWWLKNGVCRRCPSRCTKCHAVKGAAVCDACQKPYRLQQGRCMQVVPPPTGNCTVTPTWHTMNGPNDPWGWDPVYGSTDSGACVKCTPTGDHKEWCKKCDGDKPSQCTLCEDGNNGFPMWYDQNRECQFCSNAHAHCTSCENLTAKCLKCESNFQPDGMGGCEPVIT